MLRFCQQVANVFKSMSDKLDLINSHNIILPYIYILELCFQPVEKFHFKQVFVHTVCIRISAQPRISAHLE